MTETSQILDLLREVVELKKLNANLIKSAPIEDLVGDTYANLYESIVPQLITKSNAEENRVRMRVDHLLMKTNPVPDEPSIEPLVLITKAARPKSVGRREIQRKAEALVAKPPLLTIVPSIKPITISSETQVLTAIAIMEKDADQTKASTLLTVREREDVGKDVSSVPGSLHDSADDESELSEIEDGAEEGVADYGEADGDEDGGAKMLFPNLSAKGSKAGDGDEDKNREVEDEDEDEEENGSRMEVDEENGIRMEVDEE